jgi:hypothetical protein
VEVWLADRVARRVDSDELTAEYAELIRARADEREHLAALAECELRELRAKYVSADWVRRRAAWQERIVRRELAAMIDRLAPRLVGLDEVTARAAFKDEARRTLNAIATATG